MKGEFQMRFTVELSYAGLCFRLQKNDSWRRCVHDRNLQESDLTCDTPSDVTARSSAKGVIDIDGIIYHIEPNLTYYFDGEKELYYSSSVFRREYPEEPKFEQLRETIAKGDDEKNNIPILNVYGKFELRQPPFNQSLNDPSIVVRHESTDAGNGYVGLEAAKDEDPMLGLFVSSLERWKNHLKYHITQEYSDENASTTLEQIQKELKEIKNNWRPDY